MNKINPHKSSLKVNANIVASLLYIGCILGFIGLGKWFCWVIPLVIFILEKKSPFVKKNALIASLLSLIQILLYGIVYLIFSSNQVCVFGYCQTIDRYLTSTGGTMLNIVSFIICAASLLLAIKAYKYENLDIPLIDKVTKKLTSGLNKIENNELTKQKEK